MGENFLQSLMASGPLAGVLALGIYYVARWGQANQLETAKVQEKLDILQEKYAATIERLEKEKAAAVLTVQIQKDEMAQRSNAIFSELVPKLEVMDEMAQQLRDNERERERERKEGRP